MTSKLDVGAGGATRGIAYEEPLVFERGSSGRSGVSLPAAPENGSDDIPAALRGGPARVYLTPEGTCAVAALSAGKRGAPEAANPARRIF